MAATATRSRPKTNGRPAKARAPRPKRAKQPHLPGMAPPKVEKIERLADRFVEARDEWMQLKKPMIDARDLLYAAMKEEKLTHYEYDGKTVDLASEEKVVVRAKKVDVSVNGEGGEE